MQHDGRPDDVIHVDTDCMAPNNLISARRYRVRQTVSSIVFVCRLHRIVAGEMHILRDTVIDLDTWNTWIVICRTTVSRAWNQGENFCSDGIETTWVDVVIRKWIAHRLAIHRSGSGWIVDSSIHDGTAKGIRTDLLSGQKIAQITVTICRSGDGLEPAARIGSVSIH